MTKYTIEFRYVLELKTTIVYFLVYVISKIV